MVDVLNIDTLHAVKINVQSGTQQFLNQYGDVETVGIETGEVAVFEHLLIDVAGSFFEGGALFHIVVRDAMDIHDFFGYMNRVA